MVGGRREEKWNEEIDEDGGREANGLWWLRSRAEEIDGEVYGQSDGEISSKSDGQERARRQTRRPTRGPMATARPALRMTVRASKKSGVETYPSGGRPSRKRPDGLVDSWDLRDQRTRGLKGYASGEEPTVGRDESGEASLMEQGKNGVWRTKQASQSILSRQACRDKQSRQVNGEDE